MRKSHFLLQLPDGSSYKTFRQGSLMYCCLESYGLASFRIKNCNGFKFDFECKATSDSHYDDYFNKKISQILTAKEYDKFKRGLRYANIS